MASKFTKKKHPAKQMMDEILDGMLKNVVAELNKQGIYYQLEGTMVYVEPEHQEIFLELYRNEFTKCGINMTKEAFRSMMEGN